MTCAHALFFADFWARADWHAPWNRQSPNPYQGDSHEYVVACHRRPLRLPRLCLRLRRDGTGEEDVSDIAELSDPGAPGADDAENQDTGEAEQALCQWNYIRHYDYTDATGTYNWDVSYNLETGKRYVDERRVGGGFYKQYVLTPGWSTCSFSGIETVSLKNGSTTLTGPHNCLSGTDEEVHLEKQRLLHRKPSFIEYVCL